MQTLLSRSIVSFLAFLCCVAMFAQRAEGDTVFTTLSAARYPITSEALPTFATQISVGSVGSTATYAVRLDYPEYTALTREEERMVKAAGLTVADTIVPTATLGISRKEGLLDVSFCPIVRKGRRLLRLASCKIVVVRKVPKSLLAQRSTKVASSAPRWKQKSVLAEGRWVKIGVTAEGIYQLSAADLQKMGFSDPARVRLFGYGGRPQKEQWEFASADRVPDDLIEVPLYRTSDRLVFFAEGLVRWDDNVHEQQPYSDLSCYFLTEGDSPLPFSTLTAPVPSGTPTTKVTAHALLDNDEAAIYEGGRDLYDSYNFANGASKSFTLATPDIDTTRTAQVVVAMAASSATAVSVKVGLNDKSQFTSFSIAKQTSDDAGKETRRTTTTNSGVLKEKNTFRFSISPTVTARLNYIRIAYTRLLNANADPFSFSVGKEGQSALQIANATTHTHLWRIPDADNAACEMGGTLSDGVLTVGIDDASRRYVLFDDARTYPSPSMVEEVANQNLHADSAIDFVIIIPQSGKLLSAAERLAEAHSSLQGLRTKIVRADELYNEFSSGTPDASAYRRYLKMLYDRATTSADLPSHLLLLGDGAWDNRMHTSSWAQKDPKDFLLCFEVTHNANGTGTSLSIGDLSSYVTDDFFSWLDDSEGSSYGRAKPDVAVGRFPCHDAETANTLVSKSIAYMKNEKVGMWKNRVVILGDDMNNCLHMTGAEDVAASIEKATGSSLDVRKLYWDAYQRTYTATGYSYPQASSLARQYMAEGALLFNFIGHGSPTQISHAKILSVDDFSASSDGRLPLWIMASCKITPYDTQTDDIGREALANASGGAVAVLAAARSVYADRNVSLNSAFCKYLLQADGAANSMGTALMRAKSAIVDDGSDATFNKLKYALLGDPALHIGMAKKGVVVDSINGEALTAESMVQLRAGSVARFSGHIGTASSVEEAFAGLLTVELSDREETVTCKNNSGGDKVMTYKSRTKQLFSGSDSIRAGRFTIELVVPRDISYSTDCGRLSLYAVNADNTEEYNGLTEQFYLNGSASTADADTLAPTVYPYLDSPDFANGGIVGPSPTFFATIEDDYGINVSSSAIGHDIELVLDDDVNQTFALTSQFAFDFGSYRRGTVSYPLSDLSEGRHTLRLRAWDVNNNQASSSLTFYVSPTAPVATTIEVSENPATTSTNFVSVFEGDASAGTSITLEVYNVHGQRVWWKTLQTSRSYDVCPWNLTNQSGAPLPAGMYLFKARFQNSQGKKETKAKRLIIVR